jgi:hypothetical protein
MRALGGLWVCLGLVLLNHAAPASVFGTICTDGIALKLDANSGLNVDGTTEQWNDESGYDRHAVASGDVHPSATADGSGNAIMRFAQEEDFIITGGLDIGNGHDRTICFKMAYYEERTGASASNEMFGTATTHMVDIGGNQIYSKNLRLRDNSNDQNEYSAANSLDFGVHVICIEGGAAGTKAWADSADNLIINVATKHIHYTLGSVENAVYIGSAGYAQKYGMGSTRV